LISLHQIKLKGIYKVLTCLTWPNLTTNIAARLHLAPAVGLFAFLNIDLPHLT